VNFSRTVILRASYDYSQNKLRLFSYTALADCYLYWRWNMLSGRKQSSSSTLFRWSSYLKRLSYSLCARWITEYYIFTYYVASSDVIHLL
jgi:hypothetical protein